jgi:hypothetical protein
MGILDLLDEQCRRGGFGFFFPQGSGRKRGLARRLRGAPNAGAQRAKTSAPLLRRSSVAAARHPHACAPVILAPSPPRFPTATHKDLADKLYASPLCQGSARFKRPKLSQTAFTIDHYAGVYVWRGGFGYRRAAPPPTCALHGPPRTTLAPAPTARPPPKTPD